MFFVKSRTLENQFIWQVRSFRNKSSSIIKYHLMYLRYFCCQPILCSRIFVKLYTSWFFQLKYWEELEIYVLSNNAQKMKFSIKEIFSKWDQIRRKLRIWSHLLKKSVMENSIFFFFFFFAVKAFKRCIVAVILTCSKY